MNTEIERKFLSNGYFPYWNYNNSIYYSEASIRQGYFRTGDIRIRIMNEEIGFLTIKGERAEASRQEFEYEIPIHDADAMLLLFCPNTISKTRYSCKENDVIWEIDVFHESNEGLVLAEVELESEDQEIILPDWVGNEVTNDTRYYNYYLSKNPYRSWNLGDRYG